MKLADNSESETPDYASNPTSAEKARLTSRRKLFLIGLIVFIALGVRVVNWDMQGREVSVVQTSVVLNYKHFAELIRANGLASLYHASSETSDPDLLGHPPGYPILLSFIYRVAGESDVATQTLQMVLDSVSAVLIFLIAIELFPATVGLIAGLLAAFAPQFSWNSILLLPDSLAALPILLALFLMTRSCQHVRQAFLPEPVGQAFPPVRFINKDRQECLSYLAAGALIGISCWLRANALLLAPFMALSFLFIYQRGERLRPALPLIFGAFLIISPLTIRNAVVYGKFIPVSLGAGQTLIEGLADYNTEGSLGLPQTDMELIRSEAETLHRPDYANSLFTPDGPARDRARLARGFAVIRAHPVWFAGVMVRRAVSMLRLERTPLRLSPANSAGSWRLIQLPVRMIQRLFITAIFLPLTLIGAGLLIHQRRFRTLAFLLVVPCYYFCVQSALHTEYRYVLVIHYFLFTLAALAIYTIGCEIKQRMH